MALELAVEVAGIIGISDPILDADARKAVNLLKNAKQGTFDSANWCSCNLCWLLDYIPNLVFIP